MLVLSWLPFEAIGAELHDLAAHGDITKLKAHFSQYPDVDVNATDYRLGTPLHHAALSDNIAVAEEFIARGAEIEAVGELQGSRPLHLAAEFGSLRVAQLLLQSGASIEAVDANHRTALARAAIADQVEILDLLLKHGAPVDGRDKLLERTALIEAANVGAVDSVRFLLRSGANVDGQDDSGKSAVWYALLSYSRAEGPALLQLLVREGADIEAADETGMTPLAWVRARDGTTGTNEVYREMETVLVELGARR